MNPITNAEINELRNEISTVLRTPCIVLKKGEAISSTGTRKDIFTPVDSLCRIVPMTADPLIKQYSDLLMGSAGWIVSMPYDTDITSQDTIEIEGNSGQVHKYKILGIVKQTPAVFLKIICRAEN